MNLNKIKYEENKPFHPFRVLQWKTRHTAKRTRQSLFKIIIKMEAVNSKVCFVSGVPHVLNERLHNFVAVRHVGDHVCHVVLWGPDKSGAKHQRQITRLHLHKCTVRLNYHKQACYCMQLKSTTEAFWSIMRWENNKKMKNFKTSLNLIFFFITLKFTA